MMAGVDGDQLRRAQTLRALHLAPELLVLVNAWDAASARAVASAPGCRALATASWSIAAARGVEDGSVGLAGTLEAISWAAGAVDVPVSADLEDGFGDVGAAVRGAIAAGAVGANLEDAMGPTAEHVAAIEAARAVDPAFVVNARPDAFLLGARDPLAEALERGRAYLDAGADCVFVPGAVEAQDVVALVEGMGGPVSVLATPTSPPLRELQRMGVARVSFGPGTMGVAMAALARAAEGLLAGGELPADLADRTAAPS